MENNKKRYNITLEGVITLLSPLSHIGGVQGTDSLLVRGKVFDPIAKKPREVFRYNGNAFRGKWRDCGALYLFEKLGGPKMNLDIFHLFTSGGAIAGAQTVDLERAETIRKCFPLISIFGGGAKSQILEGKMDVGFGVPLVQETQGIIPERFRSLDAPPWRLLTEEVEQTRQDDSKKANFKQFIRDSALPEPQKLDELPENVDSKTPSYGPQLENLTAEQQALFENADAAPEPESIRKAVAKAKKRFDNHEDAKKRGEKKPAKKDKDGPAQQMRVTIEAMCAGTQMYHRIDLYDMTELELGAFVSCLDYWSRRPYLGGKSGAGFGLCNAEYEYWDNDQAKPFMQISQNCVRIEEPAASAQKAYDQFLLDIYNRYLQEHEANLAGILTESKLESK